MNRLVCWLLIFVLLISVVCVWFFSVLMVLVVVRCGVIDIRFELRFCVKLLVVCRVLLLVFLIMVMLWLYIGMLWYICCWWMMWWLLVMVIELCVISVLFVLRLKCVDRDVVGIVFRFCVWRLCVVVVVVIEVVVMLIVVISIFKWRLFCIVDFWILLGWIDFMWLYWFYLWVIVEICGFIFCWIV